MYQQLFLFANTSPMLHGKRVSKELNPLKT